MATQQEELAIYLLLKKAKQDTAGIAPLYARIIPSGQKLFEVYTKINIPLKYWDQKQQQLVNKSKKPTARKRHQEYCRENRRCPLRTHFQRRHLQPGSVSADAFWRN